MKILIISSYTIPDFAGGGRNAWNFGSYLTRTGKSSLILTLNRNLKLNRTEIINGTRIRRLPYFNSNLFLKSISFLFLIIPLTVCYILRSQYIYIVGGNVIGYQFFILIGSLLGKKVVFRSSLHGMDDLKTLMEKGRMPRFVQGRVLNRINSYISINPQFTESLFESGLKIRSFIESSQGVDVNVFKPSGMDRKCALREEYSIPSDTFVVLSVGHIIQRKGYDEMVEFLSQTDLELIYIIAGEISYSKGHFMFGYAEETERIINRAKAILGSKLILLGPVENTSEIYNLADVFLLGSHQEGTPNSLLEAMSCGIPVLSRDLRGISDYLVFHEKTGYLFKDRQSFSEGLQHLYSSSETRAQLAKTARNTILEDHSFEKFCKRVFEE